MFFKSLSENEKKSLLCFKEIYLSSRGQIENNNRKLMTRSELRDGIRKDFTKFSSQLTEDLVDWVLNFSNDITIGQTVADVSCLKKVFLIIYFLTSYYVNIHHFNRCSVS